MQRGGIIPPLFVYKIENLLLLIYLPVYNYI